MNQNLANDLGLSHSLLSFLFAGFQGSYASMKISGKFSLKNYDEEKLVSYDKILSRNFGFLNDVYAGVPFISDSWTENESFDAASAFDDLEKLKKDLLNTIADIVPICIKVRTQNNRVTLEDQHVLLSGYGRLLYSKDYYLRCQVQYAQVYQIRDMFEEVYSESVIAQRELANFDALSNMFEANTQSTLPSRQVIEELYKATEDLPIIFSVQAHEVTLLHNIYTKPITYQAFDIPDDEIILWDALRISPQDAGYWRAHLISPDIANNWIKLSILDPSQAYQWEKNGFNPNDASEWITDGFSAEIAGTWKRAGFNPKETAEFIKKGIQDPKNAKRASNRPNATQTNTTTTNPQTNQSTLQTTKFNLTEKKKAPALGNKGTFKLK